MMRRGRHVRCTTCGQLKQPVGRDLPAAYNGSGWCLPLWHKASGSCRGYDEPPLPDTLWPDEEVIT